MDDTLAALPLGPRSPGFLQFARWIYRPFPLLAECRERYGEWFTLRFGPMTVVFTASPEAVKDLFAADPDALATGELGYIFKPLLGPRSLLVLDGPEHRRARRLVMPPFHGERMRAYGAAIAKTAARHVASWPRDRAFKLFPALQKLTLDVILEAVFGTSESPRAAELRGLLVSLLDSTTSPTQAFVSAAFLDRDGRPPLAGLQEALGSRTAWGRFVALRVRIDALLRAEIEEHRRRAGGPDDVLSLLLQVRTEDGEPLADDELRDELITVLVAGHETTAATTAWALYRLMTHPGARERLEKELGGAGPDPLAAAQLPYLDALLNETLRLDPVAPVVLRRLKRPLTLGGRSLPAGVVVAAAISEIHRLPRLWPEPEKFEPERFLRSKPAPWEFLPWGGGSRRCLGAAFAAYEMKLILAEACRSLVLRPVGPVPRPARRGIIFAPSAGMLVTAESGTAKE